MTTKKEPTAMPMKTGGGKSSGIVSPAHAGISGNKSAGSTFNTSGMNKRAPASKR